MANSLADPAAVARANHARSVFLAQVADRAVDDPRKLDRSLRIVRAALSRGVIDSTDVLGRRGQLAGGAR